MNAKITAYLHRDTARWLRKYAQKHGVARSEMVRILLRRERQISWLARALRSSKHRGTVTRARNRQRLRVRPQAVVYLDRDLTHWLSAYAGRQCRVDLTEAVRLVVEREQEVKWFAWAMKIADPIFAKPKPLPSPKTALPREWQQQP